MRYPVSNFLDFYILQAIHHFAYMDSESEFVHSKSKLMEDVDRELERLSEDFSHALHDYIFLASFGEARHACDCIDYTLDALPTCTNRQTAYDIGASYSPKDCYKEMGELFDTYGWHGSVGGKCWSNIINSLDLIYSAKISPQAFIDYCADLKHNCGIALDKPVVLEQDMTNERLLRILNDKRNSEDFCKFACDAQYDTIYAYQEEYIHPRTASLARRYMRLYYNVDVNFSGRKEDYGYEPIEFGSYTVSIVEKQQEEEEPENAQYCDECGKLRTSTNQYIHNGDSLCHACYNKRMEEKTEWENSDIGILFEMITSEVLHKEEDDDQKTTVEPTGN